MAPTPRRVTDEDLAKRWDSGQTQREIAERVGLTPERVRQRLKRTGRSGPNPNRLPTDEEILRVARGVYSMDEIARSLQIPTSRLVKALEGNDLDFRVRDVLDKRRKERSSLLKETNQATAVGRLRALAAKLGHTPTEKELEVDGLFHARLAQIFGSAPRAMIAAGLTPNRPGYPPEQLSPTFDATVLPDGVDDSPTADEQELATRVQRLRSGSLLADPPAGVAHPALVSTTRQVRYRDPRVTAWILENAQGVCEVCGESGYEMDDGSLYLEVHHIVPLADNGPDVISNSIAACEKCHGMLHRWKDRASLRDQLYKKLSRLTLVL
jgi:hypothetical protein